MTLLVERPGPLSLVQDRGRPGLGHLGVSASGAFDRGALRQANALLGNDDGAAAIEVVAGGLVLRAAAPHVVAVTGAAGPVTIDGRQVPAGRALRLDTGQRLAVDPPTWGLRTYVGVSGGLAVAAELGSASTDTLAGLGPAPLRAGETLRTGVGRPPPHLEDVPALARTGEITVDVVLGPRDDWFVPAAVRRLLDDPWQVSPVSDRVGVRLTGGVLRRARDAELPSEPCLRGSVQVAADGLPMVFGPDHPVTGGYPVIAVVLDAHTDRLAQARPGQVVRFRRRP
ncbi:5-oxoprolinase/urea amidolyase family protein [Aeromicrobium sp. S22]|uniref:5-oxoprolinase subunit C family protein n=1 Tax=Aeromicrobium sp. S22 TaxID=2662029 RepID=UPI00129EA49B|nr:biotin-dependent carboxyltransferase family protein [Aeromicrobium sp. S22]MRK00645.1 5-oxoprolinase/urea amidolyase family protein [Aeromicrobium sp. S22]